MKLIMESWRSFVNEGLEPSAPGSGGRLESPDDLPADLIKAILSARTEVIRKYLPGTPAADKLVKQFYSVGRDNYMGEQTFLKRLRKIQFLMRQFPVYFISKDEMEDNESTIDGIAYAKQIYNPISADRYKEKSYGGKGVVKSSQLKFEKGSGLYLVDDYDWSSEESFKETSNFNRHAVLLHEFEHIFDYSFRFMMGYSRYLEGSRQDQERTGVPGYNPSRISTVATPGKGENDWSELPIEGTAEWQKLTSYLVNKGYDPRQPFTKEVIQALSFFTMIVEEIKNDGKRLSDIELSDPEDRPLGSLDSDHILPPMRKYTEAARKKWMSTAKQPLEPYPSRLPLWKDWLLERSADIPIHSSMLPAIHARLNPGNLLRKTSTKGADGKYLNVLELAVHPDFGINALATKTNSQENEVPAEISGEEEIELAESQTIISRSQLRRLINEFISIYKI